MRVVLGDPSTETQERSTTACYRLRNILKAETRSTAGEMWNAIEDRAQYYVNECDKLKARIFTLREDVGGVREYAYAIIDITNITKTRMSE